VSAPIPHNRQHRPGANYTSQFQSLFYTGLLENTQLSAVGGLVRLDTKASGKAAGTGSCWNRKLLDGSGSLASALPGTSFSLAAVSG
jgi:hypothetical protein